MTITLVLLDTSVWIEVFRRRRPFDLKEEVVTCLPVIQEVLQGFQDEAAWRIARDAMSNLPRVEDPMGASLFEEAVGLFRSARRSGRTVRSGVDCLIAACALRHDLEVWHRDRDYAALARVSALRQRSV